jgi:hypothetical protein
MLGCDRRFFGIDVAGGTHQEQREHLFSMNFFRRKSITDLQAEALSDHSLKRALGAVNLTALGIGAIIGTGIFVLTGTVAAQMRGRRWFYHLSSPGSRPSSPPFAIANLPLSSRWLAVPIPMGMLLSAN